MLRKDRGESGSTITEFGPALIVLVCFIFLPLLNIAFLPVFSLATTGALNEFTHRLSLAEKRSDAYFQLHHDSGWRDFLGRWGVRVHDPKLKLIICGKNEGDKCIVTESQNIPSSWLPDGDKGPCVYSLELSVKADLPPLCRACAGLPGFTGPITTTFHSRSQWENFGRDPATGQFYINE